ncbi:MAG: DUF2163 domain-containing protein [Ancalomicrobiaceae bacterium]|nr:DUF2163 domain-containing protein [Ancalomicrobiaceae bacterium]
MIPCSSALEALLNWTGGQTPLIQFDLYTFSLSGGQQLTYTTAPFVIEAPTSTIWDMPSWTGSGSLWHSGIAWTPFPLDDEGAKALGHWKAGLDSDSWQIKISPRAIDAVTGATFPDTIGSVPWLQAARLGYLDYADVIVSRAYFSTMPIYPLPNGGAVPVGTICIFRGQVGQVDLTRTAAFLTINDYKSILSQQMPRNLYQGSCRHKLYDARCTLSAASYTATGTALSGSSANELVATLSAPAGSGTFLLGILTMTSGANSGFSRMVTAWDGASTAALRNPFPFPIAVGDTFSLTAGCDKSMATCTAFANLVNFGGNPYIPVPEVTLGA